MRIPYVIDNQAYRLVDVLNGLLAAHAGKALDVATAYFNVQGFRLLASGLGQLGNFRLLLGDEPERGESVGLRLKEPRIVRGLWGDLEMEPYAEATLRAVEELIAFLRRDNVAVRVYEHGFLHAKCWLFYGDSPQGGWDRFQPVAAIVGSSNFTAAGLSTNKELNLSHKAVLTDEEVRDEIQLLLWPGHRMHVPEDPGDLEEKRLWKSTVGARAIADLDEWFERQWAASRDFKQELVELLDASKFGRKEYTPYQVYMKALFEYFKHDLGEQAPGGTRSAVDLAEFQEDAVKKARKILARYDGILIGDSVGLGKTWIGKKLLEDYAYHQRQKALVVSPASLREMWTRELREATIPATVVSQEELGQGDFAPAAYGDADVLLIDESHNFRNRANQRYDNIERVISMNGSRGRAGVRKKVILLTATPINNDIFDLYNQISLITRGDRTYFAGAGIGDLYRYFLHARRNSHPRSNGVALFNLLEEVVIRRTRPFIRKAYPNATIRGERISWPERKLRTVRYNLEGTYARIYDDVVSGIEALGLAPYSLESYKKAGVKRDEFEEGREQALVGIFKSRYLKRFESSIEAFRISIRRALEFIKTFESYALDGKLLDSSSFQKALRYLEQEDEEDDARPASRAEELDASEEAKEFLAGLPVLDYAQYDLRRLHDDLQRDVEALSRIWDLIRDIRPEEDRKLAALKDLLAGEMKGQKLLIFSYYRDTARYLYRELTGERAEALRNRLGDPLIRRMDSGASPKERASHIKAFAPIANQAHVIAGTEKEIDILISTDVLSEGQNLQDCGVLLNYDLHWNPMRMVQRAGRIDRIGSKHPTLWIYNMFPDEGLERLLGLVERLEAKAEAVNSTGFMDAPIFEGQVVNPHNFNTLRRIRDEDGSVIEEQEQFGELASHEALLQQLRGLLEAGGRRMLETLPDGIHSGLARPGHRGIFFYFTVPGPKGEGRRHFWRYCDLSSGRILDNRLLIAGLISCSPDTARVIGPGDVFEIQERVMRDILQSSLERQAAEAAPKIIDPIQQTVSTLLRSYLSSPQVVRNDVKAAIRVLGEPMPRVHIKTIRKAYEAFVADKKIQQLLEKMNSLEGLAGDGGREEPEAPLRPEDLHLICFDYIWS
ncbi:MAG: helicase-related protein [Planctomycetota bacterium]